MPIMFITVEGGGCGSLSLLVFANVCVVEVGESDQDSREKEKNMQGQVFGWAYVGLGLVFEVVDL